MGLQDLQNIVARYTDLIAVVHIVVGLIFCFAGYRVFKFVLGLIGFCGGLVVGSVVGPLAFGGGAEYALLGALVGGIIGAALLVTLWYVGVFLVGAGVGALAAAVVLALCGQEPNSTVLLIAGAVAGVIALTMEKFLIISYTASTGAWGIVTGIGHFAGLLDLGSLLEDPGNLLPFLRDHMMLLVAWLVVGGVGVAVQYGFSAKQEKKDREPSDDTTDNSPAAWQAGPDGSPGADGG